MNEIRTDVGVIVGRFQVPELHEAHVELIDSVVAKHTKVIMFLGLAPVIGTRNNPLDFESRRMMIQERYPNIITLYINDVPSDEVWAEKLDKMISDMVSPTQTVTLYGGRKGFLSRYKGKYKTIELEAKSFVSGSEIRNRISKSVKNSAEFRMGVIWAVHNRYPTAYATADIAILKGDEVLLGRKPKETLFQFPGGFSTPESKNFEEDAKREVAEETGVEIGEPEYLGSSFIDDWRYRNEVDKVKTLFFKAQYIFGGQPSEKELAEMRWFKISELGPSNVQDFHLGLLEMLKENLKRTVKVPKKKRTKKKILET